MNQTTSGFVVRAREAIRQETFTVGFAFWQAWWMLSMRNSDFLQFDASIDAYLPPKLMVGILTTFGYALVALFFYSSKSTGLKDKYIALSAIIGGVGSMMLFVSRAFFEGLLAYSLFYGFLFVFSIGNAFLLALWGEYWSKLTIGQMCKCLLSSYLFSFLLFFGVMALPKILCLIATSLMPVISSLFLRYTKPLKRTRSKSNYVSSNTLGQWKGLAAASILSFVWGVTQYSTSGIVSNTLSLVVAMILTVVATVYVFFFPPKTEPVAIYKFIYPTICLGILLFLLFPSSQKFVGNGFLIFGIHMLDVLVLLVSTDIAFRTRKAPGFTVCLSFFVIRTFSQVGGIFYPIINPEATSSFYDDTATLLVLLLLVLLATYFIFSEVDMRNLYTIQNQDMAGDSMKNACQSVAKQYELSKRESEVLELLALGRSAPFIAEELHIALGTAKHHIANIYRKVGVYDRQNLLTVISSERE